ncbi:helix-turn-helix domain-containing protein [Lysinibacter sp. HNR]|uniref:helix-turn-helix domain-containing protein n=1 Tax=Lysinibacter sp. HNR TaxID=3031408 RepID=UPI002435DD66|nr:helix-turn-helix domain-containing protein [Lysinibacter sp. HNR]WGD38495.1 helix-turn-helix domain-containing protein [Lysinibacter sp. HNR]
MESSPEYRLFYGGFGAGLLSGGLVSAYWCYSGADFAEGSGADDDRGLWRRVFGMEGCGVSIKALNWAWEVEGLQVSDKLLLLALADMADERNSCFPGQERLAGMTGLSVRTVQRRLQILEELGALVREKRKTPDGYRTSDRYLLILSYPSDCRVGESNTSFAPTLGDNDGIKSGVIDGVTHINPNEPKDSLTAFDVFWATYPRKVGKAAALKQFEKAVARVGLDLVMAGVKRYAADPNLPREKRFIPHPSTWLSQDRWGDEPEPSQSRMNALSLVERFREEERLEGLAGRAAIGVGAEF